MAQAAINAKICCSGALNGEEFLKFLACYRRNDMRVASSGVDEMFRLLSHVASSRGSGARAISSGPEWVRSNQCLWRRDTGLVASVHSLSPSSGALTLALKEFGQLLATDKRRKRAVAQTKNEVAVALWVALGDVNVLLGSDLEASNDTNCGWQAVVASTAKPPGAAQVFKVPHHGSVTGHSDAVWTSMLGTEPQAILTTFTSGSKPLPDPTDIKRLKGHAGALHATSPPKGWSPPKRDSAVERTLKEVVRNRRRVIGRMGQIRIRSKNNEFTVEHLGSAIEL